MFPDPSLTLTTLLRSVMLPGDRAWERLKSVHRAYLENGDTQVGVQLQYFQADRYEELNKVVNSNIMNCSLLHGFLPDVNTNSATRFAADRKPKVIKAFIASLFMGTRDFLTSTYLRHLTVTGDCVLIVQLMKDLRQEKALEVDNQALVEILALSFSDTLFVTGVSTFGGLAQAYGGTIPWYVSRITILPNLRALKGKRWTSVNNYLIQLTSVSMSQSWIGRRFQNLCHTSRNA